MLSSKQFQNPTEIYLELEDWLKKTQDGQIGSNITLDFFRYFFLHIQLLICNKTDVSPKILESRLPFESFPVKPLQCIDWCSHLVLVVHCAVYFANFFAVQCSSLYYRVRCNIFHWIQCKLLSNVEQCIAVYYAAVLVGASAAKSLKANNANLEAISKLGNSIFAGMKFLKISKVNFCGKLSYQSL